MSLPEQESKYNIVNTGAHRKPAPVIGTPALMQHFAFWYSGDIPKKRWQETMDYFLYRIFFRLWSEFSSRQGTSTSTSAYDLVPGAFKCPNLDTANNRLFLCRHHVYVKCVNGDISDSDSGEKRDITETLESMRSVRYEFFSIVTIFHGFNLSVRAELRNEFWTLTFSADLSRPSPPQLQRHNHRDISGAIVRLGQIVESQIKKHAFEKMVDPITDDEQRELWKIRGHLYEEFYKLIDSEIIEPCRDGFPFEWENIGGMFADFRGVALGMPVKKFQNVVPGMDPYDFQFRNPQKTLVPQKREPLHSACDYLPYSTNISLRIVDAMWPAIKEFYSDAEPADPKRDIAGKPELTVTRFQGKKSLYVSSLGRPTPNRSLKKEPVKYMIICGYDSRWQLGRVVERINNMGTLRLAAIYDIDRLQKISDKLRDLYGKWRKDPKPDPATFARELDALGSELPLGLAYRIERSAYYVKSFESILADMRSHLLEGFQPYADFVHRRMGGTFEFIYRIGVRYRELRNEVELTLERQRTEDIRGIEGRIRTVTEDLYDKQSTAVDLASMSNRLQNGQTSLLKRAELFLGLGAIVSIGQLVRDMVLDINPSAKGWSYSGYVVAALTVLMILTWLWSREEPVR